MNYKSCKTECGRCKGHGFLINYFLNPIPCKTCKGTGYIAK